MKNDNLIEIISTTEHEDGSVTFEMNVDKDILNLFASIGMIKVLTDALNKDTHEEIMSKLQKQAQELDMGY